MLHSKALVRLLRVDQYWSRLRVMPRGEIATFDEVATAARLRALGDGWRPVDRVDAIAAVTDMLHHALAYHVELRPLPEAMALATAFLEPFGSDAVYAVNWTSDGHDSTGWSPLTEHTFDSGIVVLGSEHAGIFCVADED